MVVSEERSAEGSAVTGKEGTKFELMLGELKEAVRALQEDRKAREVTCTAHLAITNGLVSAFTLEKGTREAIAAASKLARETLDVDAKTARETLKEAAAAARGQQHWLIERVMPFVYPLAAAVVAYFVGKGI